MSNNEVIINQKEHPDIYEWLEDSVLNYQIFQEKYTLTSDNKINVYCDVKLGIFVSEIKYPFGYVSGTFDCKATCLTSLINSPEKVSRNFDCFDCDSLTSLIGTPKEIERNFNFGDCENLTSLVGFPKKVGGDIEFINFFNNKFSNDHSVVEKYKIYLAMWLELLESVSNEERKEYIKNYKDKKEWNNKQPIIPIEILKEYGF